MINNSMQLLYNIEKQDKLSALIVWHWLMDLLEA